MATWAHLEGHLEGTWIALEPLLGDKVGAHGEYPKPTWAKAMGGSLGQSWEDPGRILGAFRELFWIHKRFGKRLRTISTEFRETMKNCVRYCRNLDLEGLKIMEE